MSGININSPAYSTLAAYEVLAKSGITSAGGAGATTVIGGTYGSSPTASGAVLTGTLDESANAAAAQTQLGGTDNSY